MTTGAASLDGETVSIVGAGVGGLSAACYLADAGAEVTVLERHDHPGGRAGRVQVEGFRFDTGPSWYLMPDIFERFFGHFGREPADYYDLERLDPHYRVLWEDGDRVDVPDDPAAVRELFESYRDGRRRGLQRVPRGGRVRLRRRNGAVRLR